MKRISFAVSTGGADPDKNRSFKKREDPRDPLFFSQRTIFNKSEDRASVCFYVQLSMQRCASYSAASSGDTEGFTREMISMISAVCSGSSVPTTLRFT